MAAYRRERPNGLTIVKMRARCQELKVRLECFNRKINEIKNVIQLREDVQEIVRKCNKICL